jgi:hypothetical protein
MTQGDTLLSGLDTTHHASHRNFAASVIAVLTALRGVAVSN